MKISRMTRASGRLRTGALALLSLSMAIPAFGAIAPSSASAGAGITAVYDAIGTSVPGNVPSQPFQAQQVGEFGDLVGLGSGPRGLKSVTIEMSSWGCESMPGGVCTTTPGHTFNQPLTLKLYAVNNALPIPATGATLLTKTVSFNIPFRPTADSTCPSPTQWRFNATTCYSGFATPVTFFFDGSLVLPEQLIWGLSFNTSGFGPAPLGYLTPCSSAPQGCPYDSLNVGLSGAATPAAGTDVDTNGVFINTATAVNYCDGGAGGVSSFRDDTNGTNDCWGPASNSNQGPYRPMAKIVTNAPSLTTTTTVVDGLHSHGWRFVDDTANALKPPSFVTGPAPTPLGTGSAQLSTPGTNDRHIIATSAYAGTPLANITSMSYSAFQPNPYAGLQLAPAMQFDINYLGPTDVPYRGRLVFEPTANGAVNAGWQSWNALNGVWWGSFSGNTGFGGLCGQASPCTWAQVLANWPNATIRGATLVKAGGAASWAGFVGNVDAVKIGVDDGAGTVTETTYDFENTAPPAVLPIVPLAVLSTQIGGENSNAQVWNADHFEPKTPGVEAVVKSALPTAAGGAVPSLINGNLKLITAANEQARVVNNFPPATAPTLREMLAQRPQYSVYADSTTSNPNNVPPASGGLQFGVQCGAGWLMSVVMSPSDLPGTKDILGALPTYDTWQTFRYPDPTDATQQVFVATDGGTAPAGFGPGFVAVSITSLIDQCGDFKVLDARASQGRSSYPNVVSYLDDLQFFGKKYDFQFVTPTTPAAVTTKVFGHTLGGENNTTAEWSRDHFEPKVPGTESVVTDPGPVGAAAGNASLLNGSVKLETVGNANGALSQQARIVHTFDPATAPTLVQVMYSRPQYSVYADSNTTPANAQGAGNLQFGVQCGSWLMSVVMAPTDLPGTTDINGNLPAYNTWQTFRYPDPADPASQIFVATDGGTAPAGFVGFTAVKIVDLLDRCANATVIDARAAQGRNSYPHVVSYMDNLTFLGHTYDFVTSIAPTITGTPTAGVVGSSYSFTFVTSGVPDPTVSAVGTLPPGLTLSAAGVLSGTPTQAGTFVFLVKSANGVLPDAQALVSVTVNPAPIVNTVPGAPTGVSALADDASASVSWTAPASNGGSPITGYTVVPTSGPGSCVVTGLTAQCTGLTNGLVYTFTVKALNAVGTGPGAVSNAVTPAAIGVGGPTVLDFTPAGPRRVFDTRPGESLDALRTVTKTKLGNGTVLKVQMTNLAGLVPATGVGAVSLNVTATNASNNGFVTVFPCGAQPFVSSVNFTQGKNVANAVIAPVSADGSVCFFANGPVDLIADVNGWFAAGRAFVPAGPARLLDTRPGQSPDAVIPVSKAKLAGGSFMTVQVTGLAGLTPASGVGTVSLNVTVDDPQGAGFITVYDCGTREEVSSVNYADGQTVANAVLAPVSASGTVCFFSQQTTDLIVDINGYLINPSGFTGVSPKRVFDTRSGFSPNALVAVSKTKVGGANVLEVKVTGLAGAVPASGVGAVSLNVTAVNPDLDGYVTVFPCGTRPDSSSVNYSTGQTVANAVITPISASGTVCFYSQNLTDLVVDVNGWFTNVPS
jgi:Fibronectin type III domain